MTEAFVERLRKLSMKIPARNRVPHASFLTSARWFLLAGFVVLRNTRRIWAVLSLFLLCPLAGMVHAQSPPGGFLDSWSFTDTTNWPSDYGYTPVCFTNLATSLLGD